MNSTLFIKSRVSVEANTTPEEPITVEIIPSLTIPLLLHQQRSPAPPATPVPATNPVIFATSSVTCPYAIDS